MCRRNRGTPLRWAESFQSHVAILEAEAVYLKLFEKLYAPLTSAILKPFKDDRRLIDSKTTQLDKLYRAVTVSLDQLVKAVGLMAA